MVVQQIRTRIRPLLAFAFAAMLSLACLTPSYSWAATSGSDIVCGETADERGLSSADLPDTTADCAMIVGKDGTVYYERNADAEVKIASLTKLMTAILTLEYGNLDDTVTVDAESAAIIGSSADLEEGDTLTVRECLRGLMIPSGNDAASVLAQYVGKRLDPNSSDPEAAFVEAMNSKAEELGCSNTVFTNPHGLDIDEWAGELHSTARDVYKMLAYAMKNDTFREIVSDENNKITVTGADGSERTYEMDTHNPLLGQDGNIGVKTGTTDDAGYCFTAAYVRDDDEIYTVVLGSDTDDQRYVDTSTLANWYYDHKMTVSAANSDKVAANGEPLIARVATTAWTDKTVDVVLADPSATVTAFAYEGDIEVSYSFDEPSGSVSKGDIVGTMTLTQNGETLATLDLAAAEDVAAPSPASWLLVQFDRLVRSVQGRSTSAATETFGAAPVLTASAA